MVYALLPPRLTVVTNGPVLTDPSVVLLRQRQVAELLLDGNARANRFARVCETLGILIEVASLSPVLTKNALSWARRDQDPLVNQEPPVVCQPCPSPQMAKLVPPAFTARPM